MEKEDIEKKVLIELDIDGKPAFIDGKNAPDEAYGEVEVPVLLSNRRQKRKNKLQKAVIEFAGKKYNFDRPAVEPIITQDKIEEGEDGLLKSTIKVTGRV